MKPESLLALKTMHCIGMNAMKAAGKDGGNEFSEAYLKILRNEGALFCETCASWKRIPCTVYGKCGKSSFDMVTALYEPCRLSSSTATPKTS